MKISKKSLIIAVMALFSAVATVPAFALPVPGGYIDPTMLSDSLTAIQADVTNVSANAWTLAFMITGIGIAIGLFKKFTTKGAR